VNRVALFAHFDAQNEVKPYVTTLLDGIRPVCDRIVFVSTAQLPGAELEKLHPHADSVMSKDNVGWDFGMWRHALEHTDLSQCDELVLTNSSILGPVYPLEPIFRRMSDEPCDFWAMTDNFEYRWHLQSYFMVFKRNVVQSEAFRAFFRSVLPYRDKGPVVLSYEVGLTSYLVENGFRPRAFASCEAWASWAQRRRMDLERRWNPTLFHPEKLLALGMPFVKLMLLRENVGNLPLGPVYRAMQDAGYDLTLVEHDREPKAPPRSWRARAHRIWSRIAVESQGSEALQHGADRAGGI
jgi:rhamnosyltransferase